MTKTSTLTERRRRTKPIIWFAAFVCAVLAVAVTIGGAAVISVYLATRPKIPRLQVSRAHLDRLNYDQSGALDLSLSLTLTAVNGNGKAHAAVSDVEFRLSFVAVPLAVLAAEPFKVDKNSSRVLEYRVETSGPLDPAAMEEMDASLKRGVVDFGLAGQARARWKVGPVVSVKFWAHLECSLSFFYPEGDLAVDLSRCVSKSH